MSKKTIGLVAKRFDNTLGASKTYLSYFQRFGDVKIVFPTSQTVDTSLDLLVIMGGPDVNPVRYGGVCNLYTQKPCPISEWFDVFMLPKYIEAGIPVFGICRGAQTLNVHFGGSLLQHIAQDYSSKSRSELVDSIKFVTVDPVLRRHVNNNPFDTTPFTTKNKKKVDYKVNSLHHQGFDVNTLAPDLLPTAINKAYHNYEAFIHRSLPVAAVQWHPEEIWYVDTYSEALINHLLNFKTEQ